MVVVRWDFQLPQECRRKRIHLSMQANCKQRKSEQQHLKLENIDVSQVGRLQQPRWFVKATWPRPEYPERGPDQNDDTFFFNRTDAW